MTIYCSTCGSATELVKPPCITVDQWRRLVTYLGPRKCLRCLVAELRALSAAG